jgi:hypothetical protein
MREETEWTPAEREALDRLPRTGDPGELLEERTVRSLRDRGLLGTGGARPGREEPRRGPLHPAWWAAGLAASLALFFGGVALGQARSSEAAVDLVTALYTAEAAERPSLVQQTGSLYVDAVASLAAVREQGDEEIVGTGVEVGLATLYAAAFELARLHPEDPRLREVLRALEARATTNPDAPVGVHWF